MYNILIVAGAIASATAFLKNFADTNCTDNEYFCGNFECIPSAKQCDGTADCSDSSDEKDCEMYHCKPPDFFRCKNSRCISSAFVCDSENDCEDFSDEENCKDFKKNFQRNVTCQKGQWQCTDKLCIPKEWVCNGESDCVDGSDETLGCSSTINCDGFKCKNGHCIFTEWRCDGQDDCMDNSDEENCDAQTEPKECTLENQRFLCEDAKTCIQFSQVCDDSFQCPDKSDEGLACKKTCEDCRHQCIQLPTGPKCICPKGYKTIDEKHCEDINECEIYGICDQKCRNTAGSYQCYCDENYSLQQDKKSCKAHFGEATMYFSSKKEIRAYFLRSQVYYSVNKNLRQVVGVDFDGQYVYWTDIFSEHESISRSLKNGEKREVLVTSGLGAPEDLRIDHVTKNIYFTDAERQHIGVCTNDGSYCTILLNKDIQKPRGIVLHPTEGEIYWSDWGHRPEIARARMDGTNDTAFVSSDMHWPNGLTIDYPNSRLYWTDAKLMTLESIRLDGTDRRVVLEGVVKHPYAIAIFENRLYWSDWATHSIQSCDKFTGKNHHTIIKEQKEYIYGISIYHPNNHRKPPFNPCLTAGCSDICLLSGPRKYTCACSQDKELGSDKRTCRDVGKRQRFVLGAENVLMEVEHKMLGRHEVVGLPPVVKKIGALAYNSLDNVLYVSDLELRKIVGLNLHSGISNPIGIVDLGKVIAMDYDYLGNNLYWCDSERSTIEVFNFNTGSRTILLHDMHGETPESITLVPEEGLMFVVFRRFDHHDSHVDRLFMDGTSRTHPIEQGLLGPISLCYDSSLHRIFIADAGTGNIESTSVEGDDRHGFRSLQTSPIGIASLKSDIFWVNKFSTNVYWADKYNNGEADSNKKITMDLPEDTDMRIVSITPRRIGLSPCQNNNGGCSHLCLQSQKRIVCACPVGLALENDNKTCIKRTQCTPEEFFCGDSNACISRKFRCDDFKHCPNGEDEVDCLTPNHCPLHYFQCQDGECIQDIRRCNSKFDCRDKSDEQNCSHVEARKCPLNHFRCKSGKCINERLVCDGVGDCDDKEDEANCVSTVCRDKEFRCLSGSCIPKDWECDHDYDCPDFSDEHPGCVTCAPTSFTCTNGKCIDRSFVCDSENDCGDNSDEISCAEPEHVCPHGQFPCSAHSSICLPHHARCNGTSECPEHEDEKNCSEDCQFDEFSCKNGKCIPKLWVCDHSDDCGDHSDEIACNHTEVPEEKYQVPCRDGFQCKTGSCINFSLVCNGEPDCFDGSDEDGVCNTSCNLLNNPCTHICLKTPSGPMCRCEDGFLLQGDGKNCEDVNECEIHPAVCSQICHNIPGLYLCDCYEGFALRNDRVSCKAEGKAMSLIFSVDDQIRELSQMENSLKLLHSEDTYQITGLDVSVGSRIIYFSDENAGTIGKIDKNSAKTEYIEDVGRPQKIALDWLTHNIYYVNNDATSKSISVCNFDDKTCVDLIQIEFHRQVSSITVDSSNKFLFHAVASWWMFNSPNYVIYKTNLDGTGSQELLKSTSGFITGLSFDLYKKALYFADQHHGTLTKINYDGTRKTLLFSNLTHLQGLSFYENQLFFQSGPYMKKCRLYAPAACDEFKFRSKFFVIVQESKQPLHGGDPCRNHTCSHMCVASKLNYKCLCADGKLLGEGEVCDSTKREAGSDERRRVFTIHHHEDYTSTGPVIAGILICICLLTFGALVCYVVKRRNSGTFNVISMRFHNPGYGLHTDEPEKASILQPGQHEYSNPIEFYDAESETSNKKEELLVNV